jgi:hypothetical protein
MSSARGARPGGEDAGGVAVGVEGREDEPVEPLRRDAGLVPGPRGVFRAVGPTGPALGDRHSSPAWRPRRHARMMPAPRRRHDPRAYREASATPARIIASPPTPAAVTGSS